MNAPLTFECEVHFGRRAHGRRVMKAGAMPQIPSLAPGRIPRIARLMALAIHFDQLIRDGAVADYAEVARLGHVTRARVSQVMNLLLLAPDIQEEILFLPRITKGYDTIPLGRLQRIALTPDWRQQRKLWSTLAIGFRTEGRQRRTTYGN
jgi:hypothetical protein